MRTDSGGETVNTYRRRKEEEEVEAAEKIVLKGAIRTRQRE